MQAKEAKPYDHERYPPQDCIRSYAQKITCTTDTLQSSLLEALGSVLRRLRSISEHSECTCVCVRVCVSKHEMQQLVLLQQLVEECGLQSAMR